MHKVSFVWLLQLYGTSISILIINILNYPFIILHSNFLLFLSGLDHLMSKNGQDCFCKFFTTECQNFSFNSPVMINRGSTHFAAALIVICMVYEYVILFLLITQVSMFSTHFTSSYLFDTIS